MISVIWVVFIGNLDYPTQNFIILDIVSLIWLQMESEIQSDDLNPIKYMVMFCTFLYCSGCS